MDIQPKDSSGKLKANDVPDEFSTELATNIMVKDGQTIVIGGLFRDVVTTSRNQVPLLGDLPLVGALLRGTNDSNQREEVIVMLTPHIVTEPEETHADARVEDISRKRFGAKDAMQWAGRARLAEDRYAKAAKYYIEGDNEAALREVKSALELRPTYLEALRLKERIIGETDPDKAAKMQRNVLKTVEQEETEKWLRR
jgi:type IV pilus assembly protein PilQ